MQTVRSGCRLARLPALLKQHQPRWVLVELGGIDGLVHLSDISWNEVGEEAVRRFKKGDELDTVILSVDPERERISLGIKQLESTLLIFI